jgi:hypothetical protein
MKKIVYSLVLIFACVISEAQTIAWSPAMDVASNTYDNLHPRVVTDRSGNPMVIWGRNSDASVFFSKWNGTGFTMPMKVNTSGLTIATAAWMGPDLASKGDTVYVVMKQTPENDSTKHIFISRSVNGGTTFSMPVQVDNIADSLSRFPVVTTDALGNPIVGFMKFDPSFGSARWAVAKSTDFGSTFATDTKASGWSGMGALVCDCCPGSITCSGNKVAMLYRDNLSNIRDMWGGISSNIGSSFTQGLGYDQGNWMLMYCPSSGPDGTIIGDTLYTAYMSGASGDELVYYNRTSLSSLSNSAGTPFTGQFVGLTQQNYPRVASAGNALATVWKQSVSGTDYLVSSFTNNATVGLYQMDTIASSYVMNGDVAMIDGKIFAVWQDFNSGTVKYRMGTYTSVTGITENIEQNSFSVYPNPANDYVNIHLSPSFQTQPLRISVCNALGKEILNNQSEITFGNILLNTKSFSNGVYFITLQSGTATCTKKIIVNNK